MDAKGRKDHPYGRLFATLVLSLGLLAGVLAAPAGAASVQPVHSRVADGGLKPSKYLNGILDAVNSAAGLTGPQGFVVGAALFLFKELINQAEGPEDAASAQLKEISEQLEALRKDVGAEFFKLQVGKTDDWITEIRETSKDLEEALEHAKRADKPGLSAQEREAELRAYRERKAEFIEGAKSLALNKVAAKLSDALVDHQEAGSPQNPERKPALLPGLRRSLAAERFLTADVSRRIRAFFEYYEWWQTRLAVVLSEYYMLGGHCLWATPGTTVAEGCTTPAQPNPQSATDRVREIEANIERQRAVAGLPAKYLGAEPLRGQVFIDTKTGYMWGVEPTYRSASQMTRTGNFADCGGSIITWPFGEKCQLAATDRFAGYSNWTVPMTDQAKSLFEPHTGNALSWLQKAGVSFTPTSRFPGYGGGFLSVRFGLLLRDRWTVGAPSASTIFDKKTRSIQGQELALEYNRGGPLENPELFGGTVAHHCPIHQSLIPYYPIFNAPDCKDPSQSAGGFILWVRGVTAAERAEYYITPG